jgi:RNA polymerase sigma-70 factor (ECF subfamily)
MRDRDSPAVQLRSSLTHLYPSLFRYARRIAGNTADAEDLVQDAMERALRRSALFVVGTPGPWLATILRNAFLDACRHRQSWKRLAPGWRRLQLELAGQQSGGGPGGTAAPLASDGYTAADVQRAVGLLAPGLRDVFCLFAFKRLSQREIGEQLSLRGSTVGTRLLRARRKLRQILEHGGAPPAAAQARRPARAGALAA